MFRKSCYTANESRLGGIANRRAGAFPSKRADQFECHLCGEPLEDRRLLTTSGNIDLVAQLDPFDGTNAYADVWGEGNYAYIGSIGRQGTGVGIIDISDPAAPSLAAHYEPGLTDFKDVKVQNGIGFFAHDKRQGVHIVDLSDPTAPTLLSRITRAEGGLDSVHNLFVDGAFLYLAKGSNPVKVFDISDPAAPTFVRDISTGSNVHDVTVVNDRLYSSGLKTGVTHIFDVTDIGNEPPTLLGSFDSGGQTHSNWPTEDGNYLVVSRECEGCDVTIYDISDPANAQVASVISLQSLGIVYETTPPTPHNPIVMGNLLFVSWYQAGLQVLDVSDPFNPVKVGSYDPTPNNPDGDVSFWGVYPFLGLDRVLLSSSQDTGLSIVDASAVAPGPPSAGITISPTSGLVTTEAGQSDSFNVVLDTLPSADVIIGISSSDSSEGTVSPNSLTFTPLDWNVSQAVTVTGVQDTLLDGDIAYTVVTAPAISADDDYSGLYASDVSVTNFDDDAPPPTTVHVADLDGTTIPSNGGKWHATVTITVHDGSHNPVAGATVNGSWSNGTSGSSSCTTDASSQCTVTKINIKRNESSVTFTVNSVADATGTYEPGENHDPDGDSDGTLIVVSNSSGLRLAGDATHQSLVGKVLTEEVLGPVVQEAIVLWTAANVDRKRLAAFDEIDIQIARLDGTVLGTASSELVLIDYDAAGYGWSAEAHATGSTHYRGVDLLSAVMHELGHVLGLNHDVMPSTLNTGVRELGYLEHVPIEFRPPTPTGQPGDANRDGQFDQQDLLAVLQTGKYLTGRAVDWSQGDWNGDGVFDQMDIFTALVSGGYLQGTDAATYHAAIAAELLVTDDPSRAPFHEERIRGVS